MRAAGWWRAQNAGVSLLWVRANPVDVLGQAALDTVLRLVAEFARDAAEVHVAVVGVTARRQLGGEPRDDRAHGAHQIGIGRRLAAADVVDAVLERRRSMHELDAERTVLDVTRVPTISGFGRTG